MCQFFLNFKKLTLSLGLVYFLSTVAYPQDSAKIDSLISSLQNASPENQYLIFTELVFQYIDYDSEKSLEYIDKAFLVASTLNDTSKIVSSGRIKGQLLRRMDRINEAVELLSKLLPISKRNNLREDYKVILNTLALAHTLKADYDKALKYHFESLLMREKDGDKADISITLNNIGLVYFKLRNYERALEYYDKSLQYKNEAKDIYDLDRLLINIGLCHNQLMNFDKAQEFIEKGLGICKEECTNQILIESKFGLGVANYGLQQYEKANLYFKESYDIALALKDIRFQAENLVYLGKISIAKTEKSLAINYLTTAEQLAFSSGYNELLIDILRQFSILYLKVDDYKSSSIYQRKYITLKDSIYSSQLIENLAKVESNYAERENLSTIADNQKVIRAQRNLNYAVAFIVVMAFAFIYLIMRNSRTVRSLNSKLALEVQLKTSELLKSNHSLKQVNDELDNLVYKTSHDIRGPLATLKGVCNIAIMDVKDEAALGFLHKLDITSTQLNQVLDKFSRVNEIYNTVIHPQKVDIAETIDAILSAQERIERVKPVQIIKEIEPSAAFESEPRLFYYALNSVIDNAFRYYNESKRVDSFVKITVVKKRDQVLISVTDNGVGIPINIDSDSLFHMFTRGSERSLTGGMGLFIATTAMRKLQGEIKFQRSADFILTEFVLSFPLKMDSSKIEKPKDRGQLIDPKNESLPLTESLKANT